MLFKMVTGSVPFGPDLLRCDNYDKYMTDGKLEDRFSVISSDLEEILSNVFKEYPSERISLDKFREMVMMCPNFFSWDDTKHNGKARDRDILRREQKLRPDKDEDLHDLFMGKDMPDKPLNKSPVDRRVLALRQGR